MRNRFLHIILFLGMLSLPRLSMADGWQSLAVPMGGVRSGFNSTSAMLDVPMKSDKNVLHNLNGSFTVSYSGGGYNDGIWSSAQSNLNARAGKSGVRYSAGHAEMYNYTAHSAGIGATQTSVSVQASGLSQRNSSATTSHSNVQNSVSNLNPMAYNRRQGADAFSTKRSPRRAPGGIYSTWVNWLDANCSNYTWVLDNGIYYLDDADMYQAYLDWLASVSPTMASMFTYGQWKEWFMGVDNTSIYQYRENGEPLADAFLPLLILALAYMLIRRKRIDTK